MANVEVIRGEIGTSDVIAEVTLTGDARHDISQAVSEEHFCTDASCDIREANENGFPYVAAWLLTGATECPLLGAVLDWYDADMRVHPRDLPDWNEWVEHFDRYGRECDCGAFTFGSDTWTPQECGNCGGELRTEDSDD